MFSQFLILGLSALSIVCAGPTPSSLAQPVVDMALTQNHTIVPAVLEPGSYKISQPFGGGPYDSTYLAALLSPPLGPWPVLMRYSQAPTWWVEKVNENKFNLAYDLYGHRFPAAVLGPFTGPGSNLVVPAKGGSFLSTWAVERAGGNQWIIKVPDVDLVWTSNSRSTVTLEKANGTPAQRWTFELK
ncbi:hypothetical protein C8R44DRAFT_893697 [Mycena epipterygia]|nr:hypothetical protein C8R44DRAFT_893697 [Mycena epipterygia]